MAAVAALLIPSSLNTRTRSLFFLRDSGIEKKLAYNPLTHMKNLS